MRLALLLTVPTAVLSTYCVDADESKYSGVYGSGPTKLVVATGSPGELGLLKAIAETFSKSHAVTVCWRKAGSGRSLQLLRDRRVDVAMVHAPAAEKRAVSDGWATRRTLIGSNEFYIVGPAEDLASVRTASTAVEAYRRIARAQAKFLSRSDNSGTHKKEMAIWRKAGIVPRGGWYVCTNDFMMAALLRANTDTGYFMTDSSTWVAARSRTPSLDLLLKGDPLLVNVYHALCQPEGATPNAATAATFVDFLASAEAQRIIRDYGRDTFGEPMYRDAEHSRKCE